MRAESVPEDWLFAAEKRAEVRWDERVKGTDDEETIALLEALYDQQAMAQLDEQDTENVSETETGEESQVVLRAYPWMPKAPSDPWNPAQTVLPRGCAVAAQRRGGKNDRSRPE